MLGKHNQWGKTGTKTTGNKYSKIKLTFKKMSQKLQVYKLSNKTRIKRS